MMKILLIAQSYYPYNSPGSHRIHSFAKYLPEHGFSPTLLCLDWNRDACLRMRKGAQYTYAATLEGKDVGRTVRVSLVPPEPSWLRSEIGYLRPLSGCGGLVPVLLARGRELLREDNFDMILATSGPLPALNVAWRLSRMSGTPWVADLRDIAGQFPLAWSLIRPWTWRSWPYLAWEIHQEAMVCRQAAAVVTVSVPLAEQLQKRGVGRVDVIFNGFEPDDYASITRHRTDQFRVVYTGVIYPSQNPCPLFTALDLLLEKKVISASDFEVCFFGAPAHELEPYLRGHCCEPLVRRQAWQPRDVIQRAMREASLLLQLAHGERKGIVTSKLFEYLGARRPILSIPKDHGVVDAILEETGAGQSATSPTEVAAIILRQYTHWKETRDVDYYGRPEAIARYTRQAQAVKLAKVLHQALDCRPTVG